MEKNNTFDMSWGHPEFLHPYWMAVNLENTYFKDFHDLKYHAKTSSTVQDSIKLLHKDHQNAIVDDKIVIVGNGATQIIKALMNILGGPVYAPKPHFSRFPVLAKKEHAVFTNAVLPSIKTQILTIPNNPDAKIKHPEIDSIYKIYDLSYNWSNYTTPINFDEDIMVFSLSKATGHASARIGWGIFKDKKLAEEVEQYIEYDTSGVSYESQNLLLNVIKYEKECGYQVFNYGKLILGYRWKMIEKKAFDFSVLNNQGMFMWCKGNMPKKFKGLSGIHFGMDDTYFRLNIGCDNKTFTEFINEYT